MHGQPLVRRDTDGLRGGQHVPYRLPVADENAGVVTESACAPSSI